MKNLNFSIALPILLMIILSSCVQHKDLVNFQTGKEFQTTPANIQNLENVKIQPDDILKITVHSFNEAAVQPFNINYGETTTGTTNNIAFIQLSGFLVDSLGNINFPVIGKVNIGNKTLDEATTILQDSIRPYVSDIVVNTRFLNFRYTIIGEVNAPGTYSTINKRITLIEALGSAGDLTQYANREKILLVREVDGKRTYANLNLKDKQIFESPYFYIHQNDMIYVEPNPTKVATVQDPFFRYLSVGSVALSFITLVIALTK